MTKKQTELTPQVRSAGTVRAALRPAREIATDELDARREIITRLFQAWPTAKVGGANIDVYVNAMRGMTLRSLAKVVSTCIEAGGEFCPPAGEVYPRACRYHFAHSTHGYNVRVTQAQASDQFIAKRMADLRLVNSRVRSVTAGDQIRELAAEPRMHALVDGITNMGSE